jgi:hypothetical protein
MRELQMKFFGRKAPPRARPLLSFTRRREGREGAKS